MLSLISQGLIPFVILGIVVHGSVKHVDVFDAFCKGAKEGCKIIFQLAPILIGLFMAIGILRASGILESCRSIGGINKSLPVEIVPLLIVRLFSSSAAISLVADLYKKYGTDSKIGLSASILMCCTESVFYMMSIYFMAIKIRKTKWTLPGALIATAAGTAASLYIAFRIAT